jgi:hypothetical protein
MTGQPVRLVQTLIGQLDHRTISNCIRHPEGNSRNPCLVDSLLECRRLSAGSKESEAICIPLYRISLFFFLPSPQERSPCLS